MFIDFSHRFKMLLFSSYDVLNRKRPRVKIANRNPWYDKMKYTMQLKNRGHFF